MGVIRRLTRLLPVPGPLGLPGPYPIPPGTRLRTNSATKSITIISKDYDGKNGSVNKLLETFLDLIVKASTPVVSLVPGNHDQLSLVRGGDAHAPAMAV